MLGGDLAHWRCFISGQHNGPAVETLVERRQNGKSRRGKHGPSTFPLVQPSLLWLTQRGDKVITIARMAQELFPRAVAEQFPLLAARCNVDHERLTNMKKQRGVTLRARGAKRARLTGELREGPKRKPRPNKAKQRWEKRRADWTVDEQANVDEGGGAPSQTALLAQQDAGAADADIAADDDDDDDDDDDADDNDDDDDNDDADDDDDDDDDDNDNDDDELATEDTGHGAIVRCVLSCNAEMDFAPTKVQFLVNT